MKHWYKFVMKDWYTFVMKHCNTLLLTFILILFNAIIFIFKSLLYVRAAFALPEPWRPCKTLVKLAKIWQNRNCGNRYNKKVPIII